MAWTVLPPYTVGRLTAAMLELIRGNLNDLSDGSWGREVTFASTVSNIATPLSGAFGDVTGFSFPAVAGGRYAIDCVMFLVNSASSTPDWKSGWSWTGSGAMTSGQSGLDVNVATPAYNGNNTAHAIINTTSSPLNEGTGLGTPSAVEVVARVAATYVCTTGGTVQMRHAQATSDATFATVVLHGSRMRVERIL